MISLYPLRIIPENSKIDFMGIRKFNFVVSLIFVITSFSFIFFSGINFGIDFKGGILIEANFDHKPDIEKIRTSLNFLNMGDIKIQDFDEKNIMIRIGNNMLSKGDVAKQVTLIKEALKNEYTNSIDFRKTDYVGPQVGTELIQKGLLAIFLSFVAILCYVAFRFQWHYGAGIIIALIHDLIFSIGMMSAAQLEFDLTTIAALLTIIGYSVNDSVVIYDRIRENFKKYTKISTSEIINLSINETLSRTVLTVTTTLISVLALIIYGGAALHSFSVIVFFGIIIGTYSSIYISAPILIYLGLNKPNK
jgi:preprotein translocase subunit SecF